jgi:hypothetical protein
MSLYTLLFYIKIVFAVFIKNAFSMQPKKFLPSTNCFNLMLLQSALNKIDSKSKNFNITQSIIKNKIKEIVKAYDFYTYGNCILQNKKKQTSDFKQCIEIGERYKNYLKARNSFISQKNEFDVIEEEEIKNFFEQEKIIDLYKDYYEINVGTIQHCSFMMCLLGFFIQRFDLYGGMAPEKFVEEMIHANIYLSFFSKIEYEKINQDIKNNEDFACISGPKDYQIQLEQVLMTNGYYDFSPIVFFDIIDIENFFKDIYNYVKKEEKNTLYSFLESSCDINKFNLKPYYDEKIHDKEIYEKLKATYENKDLNIDSLKKILNNKKIEDYFDYVGPCNSGHFSLLYNNQEDGALYIVKTKNEDGEIVVSLQDYIKEYVKKNQDNKKVLLFIALRPLDFNLLQTIGSLFPTKKINMY